MFVQKTHAFNVDEIDGNSTLWRLLDLYVELTFKPKMPNESHNFSIIEVFL
jgi:hypothetical protein